MGHHSISKESAFKRLAASGLTIAEAILLEDNDLLRYPQIGRRTLRFIRAFVEVIT